MPSHEATHYFICNTTLYRVYAVGETRRNGSAFPAHRNGFSACGGFPLPNSKTGRKQLEDSTLAVGVLFWKNHSVKL